MRSFFPAKFGRREYALSSLAITLGIVSGLLTVAAGYGAIGVMLFFTLVGTVFFVAVAGRDRSFFTALFTSSQNAIWALCVVVIEYFVQHEGFDEFQWLQLAIMCALFAGVPVMFAWLVTLFSRSAASTTTGFRIPQAVRNDRGDWLVSFRVIASDDFKPVADVEVEFNWLGTDGGVRIYRTNLHGILEFSESLSPTSAEPFYRQQVYHLVFSPPKGSRFAPCTHAITIHADGTYFPDQFSLPFYETTVEGMKDYAAHPPVTPPHP